MINVKLLELSKIDKHKVISSCFFVAEYIYIDSLDGFLIIEGDEEQKEFLFKMESKNGGKIDYLVDYCLKHNLILRLFWDDLDNSKDKILSGFYDYETGQNIFLEGNKK